MVYPVLQSLELLLAMPLAAAAAAAAARRRCCCLDFPPIFGLDFAAFGLDFPPALVCLLAGLDLPPALVFGLDLAPALVFGLDSCPCADWQRFRLGGGIILWWFLEA